MSEKILEFNAEQENLKTAEQVFDDLLIEEPEETNDTEKFISQVIAKMKRRQNVESSIVRDAAYALPSSVTLKDEHLVEGTTITTMELLKIVVKNYLENNN